MGRGGGRGRRLIVALLIYPTKRSIFKSGSWMEMGAKEKGLALLVSPNALT